MLALGVGLFGATSEIGRPSDKASDVTGWRPIEPPAMPGATCSSILQLPGQSQVGPAIRTRDRLTFLGYKARDIAVVGTR
jgi:hypothetical protein